MQFYFKFRNRDVIFFHCAALHEIKNYFPFRKCWFRFQNSFVRSRPDFKNTLWREKVGVPRFGETGRFRPFPELRFLTNWKNIRNIWILFFSESFQICTFLHFSKCLGFFHFGNFRKFSKFVPNFENLRNVAFFSRFL